MNHLLIMLACIFVLGANCFHLRFSVIKGNEVQIDSLTTEIMLLKMYPPCVDDTIFLTDTITIRLKFDESNKLTMNEFSQATKHMSNLNKEIE